MAVQFKFRSSVNFDSVDIDGRASISFRDLKSKITRHKNLNICQDSDLVFSDAITGQEYTDESIQIPCGSSVIIKRVPAGSVHLDMAELNLYRNNLHSKNSVDAKSLVVPDAETVDFDDFGVDLYPVLDATSAGPDLGTEKEMFIHGYQPNADIQRYLEPAVRRGQKLEASGLSDAIPEGQAHIGVEHTIQQTKSRHEEDMNLEKLGKVNPLDTRHVDWPSQLKCSLCNSFFKEAMLIPCCQHSFCEKCIWKALLEKARCPKCLSKKCRVEDLLPNVSLRQAIEHVLESQNLVTVQDNACCEYAPDGESGIHAKDVSCGGTVLRNEQESPHSPETGMGSNHSFSESASNSPFKRDAPNHLGANNFLKKHGYTRMVPDGLVAFDGFEGESKLMHEQDEPIKMKRRPPGVYAAGCDKSFLGRGKHRRVLTEKGDHFVMIATNSISSLFNAPVAKRYQSLVHVIQFDLRIHVEIERYMCGSPDHFVRDCPVALSPHPMFRAGNAFFPGAMPGYVPPYWNKASSPHAQSFRNPYGNHMMTTFDTHLAPLAPFAVPTYITSVYSSFPAFGGYMRMTGGASVPGTAEGYISHSEYLDLQGREKRRKTSNENLARERSHDDDEDREGHHCNGIERSYDHKSYIKREKSISYSDDGSSKGSRRQYRHHNRTDYDMLSVDGQRKSSRLMVDSRDQKPYHHRERSSSEVDDMPGCSRCPSEEKHKHYHRCSRKHKERREPCGSDSSHSHHKDTSKKGYSRKTIENDSKRHNPKHGSHSGSVIEQSVSSHKKLQKESSRSFRHFKCSAKSNADEPTHDRWKMVSGSDEDDAEGYQYCRWKRKH